jgi:hypothetical protein
LKKISRSLHALIWTARSSVVSSFSWYIMVESKNRHDWICDSFCTRYAGR